MYQFNLGSGNWNNFSKTKFKMFCIAELRIQISRYILFYVLHFRFLCKKEYSPEYCCLGEANSSILLNQFKETKGYFVHIQLCMSRLFREIICDLQFANLYFICLHTSQIYWHGLWLLFSFYNIDMRPAWKNKIVSECIWAGISALSWHLPISGWILSFLMSSSTVEWHLDRLESHLGLVKIYISPNVFAESVICGWEQTHSHQSIISAR